jgi:hypothetical protein
LRKSVKTDKYLTVFGRKGAGNVHVEQRQQPVGSKSTEIILKSSPIDEKDAEKCRING